MKTLQDIKINYAQEQGYEDWETFLNHYGGRHPEWFDQHWQEICSRAQKAALEKAAENVTLISEHLLDNVTSLPKCVIVNGISYSVYSESITNPENLIR